MCPTYWAHVVGLFIGLLWVVVKYQKYARHQNKHQNALGECS